MWAPSLEEPLFPWRKWLALSDLEWFDHAHFRPRKFEMRPVWGAKPIQALIAIIKMLCAPGSPCHRTYIERVIGNIRREGLDHVIIFSEPALYRHVKSFAAYHGCRTHLSLAKDPPEPRAVQPPDLGRIMAIPQVGGLHQRYQRRVA